MGKDEETRSDSIRGTPIFINRKMKDKVKNTRYSDRL